MKKKRFLVFVIFCISCMLLWSTTASAAITISKKTRTINVGKTYTLKLNGTSKTPKWKSSNPQIAKVSSKGKVTALKAGKCKITATLKGKTYTCTVTVKVPVTDIILNAESLNKKAGNTFQLKWSVKPRYASNKEVTFTTGNSAVATVTSSGRIKAVGGGTTTITVAAKDGSGVKKTCKVTVTVPVSSITFNAKSTTMRVGETVNLNAAVNPSNATNKKITYKSSNTKIATVSENGEVTAIALGTVTITATAQDGSKVKGTYVMNIDGPHGPDDFLRVVKKYADTISSDIKAGNGWRYCAPGNTCKSSFVLERENNRETTCAVYIIWALRELGVLTNADVFEGGDGTILYYGGAKGRFEEYADIIYCHKTRAELIANGTLKPGDICMYNWHSNVYAGNNKWYDGGRIGSNGKYIKGLYYFTSIGPFTLDSGKGMTVNYIIRLKK